MDAAPWRRSSTALVGGRAAYAHILSGGADADGPGARSVAALAALFAPDGRLTARCRECYEFRLHRARGYGALKAILGVLAETKPLNLTEISQRLRRTPGSTKDYLSWLEDVDLVTVQRKRYSFDDPLLRAVRAPLRPSGAADRRRIVREVRAYAQTRLPHARLAAPTAPRGADRDHRPSSSPERRRRPGPASLRSTRFGDPLPSTSRARLRAPAARLPSSSGPSRGALAAPPTSTSTSNRLR